MDASWIKARRALTRERAELQDRLRETRRYGLNDAMNDAAGELSGYDQHPADLGSEMFERARNLALGEHDLLRLEAIEQALQRLDEGVYGRCAHCGGMIEPLRLEAEPAAAQCMGCANGERQGMQNRDRPIEEEVLRPPAGRSTNGNGRGDDGLHGEDAWEVVARMNARKDPDSPRHGELCAWGSGNADPDVDSIEQISNQEYKSQLPD
ncbi:MAG: TraR/DksA C4-type zinc finger protein [Acidimicrobiales bacterium]